MFSKRIKDLDDQQTQLARLADDLGHRLDDLERQGENSSRLYQCLAAQYEHTLDQAWEVREAILTAPLIVSDDVTVWLKAFLHQTESLDSDGIFELVDDLRMRASGLLA